MNIFTFGICNQVVQSAFQPESYIGMSRTHEGVLRKINGNFYNKNLLKYSDDILLLK